MSLGIVVADTIVSSVEQVALHIVYVVGSDTLGFTVEVGVAVYSELLGDFEDPNMIEQEKRKKQMKRGCRRVPQSVVRRLANTIPLKPEPRLKIPISRFQEEYGISVSNGNAYSVSPFEDTSWMYEEEGQISSSYRTHRWTPNPYPKDFVQRWELKPPTLATPSRSRFGSSASCQDNEDADSGCDIVTKDDNEIKEERVVALENELASLKAMMASFALQSMQPIATSTPAPPPAPPAPPPPAMSGFKTPAKPLNFKKSEKKPEAIQKEQGLDMNALLKDVGKQKGLLKSVEKSPGGTPIRQKPKSSDPHDPSVILANALRMKFANQPQHDMSSDREASFNDSDLQQPDSPGSLSKVKRSLIMNQNN